MGYRGEGQNVKEADPIRIDGNEKSYTHTHTHSHKVAHVGVRRVVPLALNNNKKMFKIC